MTEWSSTPSVPHTGGTFDFPKNTSTSGAIYTISYIGDNGCESSIEYTVHPCSSSCNLFTPIPEEQGLIITTIGEKSIVVFSYVGDININGNQRKPTAKLNNGLLEDDYIKINSIEESIPPYGKYSVNYEVKTLPPADYSTQFIISNDCRSDTISVNITIKAQKGELTSEITEKDCSTKQVFTLNSSYLQLTGATLNGTANHIKISTLGDSSITVVSDELYKIDNTNPDSESTTLTATDSNGATYTNDIIMYTKWQFSSHVEVIPTNAFNMPPTSTSSTHVKLVLDFCPTDSSHWTQDMNTLAEYITNPLNIKWTYTYWQNEASTAQTAYTTTISVNDIKSAIRNCTKSNLVLLDIQTPSNHNLPGAYWGQNYNKTYCLKIDVNLKESLPQALYRGLTNFSQTYSAHLNSACEHY